MDKTTLKQNMNALRTGDKAAFEALYRDLKKPVYTILFRILYNQDTAEDVMQDVFVKLFCSPPDPKVENLRAWIFQMARNLAIDTLRRKTGTDEPSEDYEDIRQSIADTVHERIEVEEALAKLPEKERSIVTLHVNAGFNLRETAAILAMPQGTVRWKYRQAIGRLRDELNGGK